MKIKKRKASLREVNRGLKMHKQKLHERAATTHEQQPDAVSIDAAEA